MQPLLIPSRVVALLLSLITLLLPACGASFQEPVFDGEGPPSGYSYAVPAQIDGDWPTGPLSSVGVDSVRLIQLMNRVREHQHHRIHSILVVRNGVLVFEEYFPGDRWIAPGVYNPIIFTRDSLHFQASTTKSVTAIAVGIAHDQGLLDLDTPVLSFFPDLADLAVDGREEITLEHLITMRSGLPWDESSASYSEPANDVFQLFHNPDPLRYIFSQEMEAPAGTFFRYHSGATNVLGKVVELVSGQDLDSFTEERLFRPLGISEYMWERINSQLVFASGGLHLKPRDMARIGELFLREGIWEGEQLVSTSWVSESSVSRSPMTLGWADGYGYGWWTRTYSTSAGPIESYFTAGWGEQQIIVIPQLDLVAVFTGGSYDEAPFLSPGQIMAEYVIPAALAGL